MLSVDHLQVSYGRVPALWDVSFTVPAGEIVALVGANGAGKTTTLRTISGLLKPRSGTITFNGERLDGRPSTEIVQRGIVHVPEARRLFPEMSVHENLLMGAYATAPASRAERLDRVFS